jgi:hypothetical protein
MMRRYMMSGLPAILAIVGCATSKIGDLAGDWVLTEQARTELHVTTHGPISSIVQMKLDGQFSATGVPGKMAGQPASALIDGGGRWRVDASDGNPRVFLRFGWVNIGHGPIRVDYDRPMEISGSRDVLYYFVGDPDDNLRIEFTRKR